jgi:hypothetical protein
MSASTFSWRFRHSTPAGQQMAVERKVLLRETACVRRRARDWAGSNCLPSVVSLPADSGKQTMVLGLGVTVDDFSAHFQRPRLKMGSRKQ